MEHHLLHSSDDGSEHHSPPTYTEATTQSGSTNVPTMPASIEYPSNTVLYDASRSTSRPNATSCSNEKTVLEQEVARALGTIPASTIDLSTARDGGSKMHTHCQITDTPTDRPPSYEDLCNADADLAHSRYNRTEHRELPSGQIHIGWQKYNQPDATSRHTQAIITSLRNIANIQDYQLTSAAQHLDDRYKALLAQEQSINTQALMSGLYAEADTWARWYGDGRTIKLESVPNTTLRHGSTYLGGEEVDVATEGDPSVFGLTGARGEDLYCTVRPTMVDGLHFDLTPYRHIVDSSCAVSAGATPLDRGNPATPTMTRTSLVTADVQDKLEQGITDSVSKGMETSDDTGETTVPGLMSFAKGWQMPIAG